MFEGSNRFFALNHEFQRLKAGGYTWWVHGHAPDDQLQTLIENPDCHLQDVTALSPHDRPSTNVNRVTRFFLKRYNRASLAKMIKSIFRLAPAHRAFHLAHQLERVGIPTPRALAVANKRVARVLLRSYLVTENIPEAKTLDQWDGDRRVAARRVASLVARLHDQGFIHRDLNPQNVLHDPRGRFLLVDLDTMRCIRKVPEHRALDDLARFSRKALLSSGISRSDRARFLKEYCRLRGFESWGSWWTRIEQLNRLEYERLDRKSRRAPSRPALC